MEVYYNNFSFGNSSRGKTNLNNVPGPGLYNSKTGFDKKGAKFNVEDRKININNLSTPGPGQYYLPCSIVDVPNYLGGKFQEKYKWV